MRQEVIAEFESRLQKHHDELRWLYMELYNNVSMFFELMETLREFYEDRSSGLKAIDRKKEADPNWYRRNDLLGMMLYIDNFGGTIQGVKEKLPYFEKSNVNYIHLMPFLDTVPERSDGGYAVEDFRKVQPSLGTMEDLEDLTEACHEKGIQVCMDFVMNQTSEDHEWAQRARNGEGEYMSVTGDARLCGTTASLCGLQAALEAGTPEAVDLAIDAVVMLHAYMFMQSGIPVLYSGDEIGQLNDNSYHADPNKAADSRYLHRGKMDWAAAARAEQPGTSEYRIFTALAQLETLRAEEAAFSCDAIAATLDTGNKAILGIARYLNGEQLVGLFNFSDEPKTASAIHSGGIYKNLVTGETLNISEMTVPAQGFVWLKRV